MFPARNSHHSPLKKSFDIEKCIRHLIRLIVPGAAVVVVVGSEAQTLGPFTQVAHEPTEGQLEVKVQMLLDAS